MEFIIELIIEIILEGTIQIGTSRKVPVGFRILAIAILTFVYVGFVVMLATFAVNLWKDGSIASAVVVGVIDLVVAVFLLWGATKKIKEHRQETL
jgi:hypothetical protein